MAGTRAFGQQGRHGRAGQGKTRQGRVNSGSSSQVEQCKID